MTTATFTTKGILSLVLICVIEIVKVLGTALITLAGYAVAIIYALVTKPFTRAHDRQYEQTVEKYTECYRHCVRPDNMMDMLNNVPVRYTYDSMTVSNLTGAKNGMPCAITITTQRGYVILLNQEIAHSKYKDAFLAHECGLILASGYSGLSDIQDDCLPHPIFNRREYLYREAGADDWAIKVVGHDAVLGMLYQQLSAISQGKNGFFCRMVMPSLLKARIKRVKSMNRKKHH